MQAYTFFLKEAWKRGMLTFRHVRGGDMGVFFVRQEDDRLRTIFDTRVINCDVWPAPSTRLPTPSSFGALEADQKLIPGVEQPFLYCQACDVNLRCGMTWE